MALQGSTFLNIHNRQVHGTETESGCQEHGVRWQGHFGTRVTKAIPSTQPAAVVTWLD